MILIGGLLATPRVILITSDKVGTIFFPLALIWFGGMTCVGGANVLLNGRRRHLR